MIDPFEEHPDTPPPKKKKNNDLTLEKIKSIIEEEISLVNKLAPRTWGFEKQDIIEHLRNALQKVENKCQFKE